MYRLFLIILVAIAINANAVNRDIVQLKAIAAQHFAKKTKAKGHMAMPENEVKMLKQNDELAVLGIEGKGFVVVAIDDANEPILGYSDTDFPEEGQNPAFYGWLENTKKALSLGIRSTAATAIPAELPASVEPYCSAIWNQSNPYDRYVPTYKSGTSYKHYPTGCVATAMAEAMYYYKYPENGTGLVRNNFDGGEGEGAKFITIQLDTLKFDWDNMLPQYKSNYTDKEANAVAWLMFACGTSVQMGYTPSGSGAYTDKAYNAMVKNFGYSNAMPYYFRDMISVTEWNNAIYSSMAKGMPLITAGASSSGGHCFILDGYDEKGNVHVNWGWGGNSNGYFDLSLLNGYENQQDFFPLSKDMQGEHHSKFGMYRCGFDAMNADKTHLRMSVSGYMYNIDPVNYTKDIYFVARDINSGKDYLLATQSLGGKEIGYIDTHQELYGISKNFVTIVNKIGDGTYNVFVATKSDEESQYQPVRAHEQYNDCYIMQVQNGEIVSFGANKNGWLIGTGIQNVELSSDEMLSSSKSNAVYSISGQRVGDNFRGISIQNGKKIIK